MDGQYTPVAQTVAPGSSANVAIDVNRNLIVSQSGASPVGGGVAYADKTLTSLTGSSQTMMAANAARKSLLIKNGDTNAGVNLLGGTALIGGAGTITLQPYEGLFLKGADCPVGAITVIGTSTKYLSGYEGS